MITGLLMLLAFWVPAVAGSPVELGNDREGKSFYLAEKRNQKQLDRVLREAAPETITGAFSKALSEADEATLCSYNLNRSFKSNLESAGLRVKKLDGALFYLRSTNQIDDVVVKLLLDAQEVEAREVSFGKDLPSVDGLAKLPELLEAVKRIDGAKPDACLDEIYRGILGEFGRINDKLKATEIEGVFYKALSTNLISIDDYVRLEQARVTELEKTPLTLKTYLKKLRALRRDFPLPRGSERSDFVTAEATAGDLSRRQRILQHYDGFQLAFMAETIKKLRRRLDSDMATLQFFTEGQLDETKVLEPQERFRAAIKLLRMDLRALGLNSFFKNRTPTFIDLMTAAYELGVVPARELDEIAKLEELWNPKKTFYQKYKVWIRGASSVGSIALPPPFGFLPSLGLMIIEATTKTTNNTTNDLGLF